MSAIEKLRFGGVSEEWRDGSQPRTLVAFSEIDKFFIGTIKIVSQHPEGMSNPEVYEMGHRWDRFRAAHNYLWGEFIPRPRVSAEALDRY